MGSVLLPIARGVKTRTGADIDSMVPALRIGETRCGSAADSHLLKPPLCKQHRDGIHRGLVSRLLPLPFLFVHPEPEVLSDPAGTVIDH